MKNVRQVTVNTSNFDRYIGYGVFEFVAINPNKAKLEELLGIKVENEPVYHTVKENIAESIIDVYMKHSSNEEAPYEFPLRVRFFLRRKYIYSKDQKSVKVVNKYGEFTFLPVTNVKENSIPENQSWYLGPYKPAFEGQEEFTKFLVAYFGIPTRSYMDKNNVRKTIENISDAEVGLDDWDKIFKGDFSELNVFNQFVNKIRIAVGVKSVDNKTYQDVFMQCFIKINNTRTDYLAKCIDEAKKAGRYSNTEFSLEPIRKFSTTLTPSTVKEVNTGIPTLDDPLDNNNIPETEGNQIPTTTVVGDDYLAQDGLPF